MPLDPWRQAIRGPQIYPKHWGLSSYVGELATHPGDLSLSQVGEEVVLPLAELTHPFPAKLFYFPSPVMESLPPSP